MHSLIKIFNRGLYNMSARNNISTETMDSMLGKNYIKFKKMEKYISNMAPFHIQHQLNMINMIDFDKHLLFGNKFKIFSTRDTMINCLDKILITRKFILLTPLYCLRSKTTFVELYKETNFIHINDKESFKKLITRTRKLLLLNLVKKNNSLVRTKDNFSLLPLREYYINIRSSDNINRIGHYLKLLENNNLVLTNIRPPVDNSKAILNTTTDLFMRQIIDSYSPHEFKNLFLKNRQSIIN